MMNVKKAKQTKKCVTKRILVSLMIRKVVYLRMKSYQNHNEDLKEKQIVYILIKQ